MVGYDSSDDAAVYRLSESQAIIQTLDFFPPMVEDPYLFGQIAATNALSDVWAMGGDVLTAMNIVAYPDRQDLSALGEILRGGAEKIKEAGGILCGGHSIHDPIPKYGLSVTGLVHPDRIFTNNAVEAGDVLVLTKPLGSGIVSTAYSAGETKDEAFLQAVRSMTTLNKYASDLFRTAPVHACTDVTGFGLAGHLLEMLGERFGAVLEKQRLPILPDARRCAEEFLITAGGQKNRNVFSKHITFAPKDFVIEELIFDPQTSGGLLYAMPEEAWRAIEEQATHLPFVPALIGRVVEQFSEEASRIVVI